MKYPCDRADILPSTAALAYENGTIAPVAYVKGSEAYQWILANSDESNAPNPALVPKVLRTSFAAIKGTMDIELGEQVRNAVITVPDYVQGDLHEPILRGAEKAGFFLNRDGIVRKLIRGSSAILSAYPPVSGSTILISYNEASLGLQMANKGSVYAETTLDELGEHAMARGSKEHYLDTIKQAIQGWLAGVPEVVPVEGYLETDIHAVIFSGDASAEAFKDLKMVVGEGFAGGGDTGGWLKDSIEPLYVAAVGAASKGWIMVDNPVKYKLQGVPSHGEL
ncbi:hypothetical protein P7C71_g5663, partial [Lecanoromycetidae sp. Uapishka_2]